MKCVYAKKKSYGVFTKNLINQILNTLSFGHIVTWTVYKYFLIRCFYIGAKNKAHIRKTHPLLNLLVFDLTYFRLYSTQITKQKLRELYGYITREFLGLRM